VATTNGNLLITFCQRAHGERGLDSAAGRDRSGGYAAAAGSHLMTALAMILGILPMSLVLGAGGSQNPPLGRAVIGGLTAATFMTLLVVPTVYSLFGGALGSKLQRDGECWNRPKRRKRRRYKHGASETELHLVKSEVIQGPRKRWTVHALWIGLAVAALAALSES
jgi:hypothetical protein